MPGARGRPAWGILLAALPALGAVSLAPAAGSEKREAPAPGGSRPAVEASVPRLVPMAGDRVLEARPLRALRPEVVAHIVHGEDGGALSFVSYATVVQPTAELPARGKRTPVLLVVEIDGPAFLETNLATGLARVELYAYAFLSDRRVASFLAQTVFVDVAELREEIEENGLRFVARMELPRGHYDLRVMVRNFHGRASGLQTLALEVPDAATGMRVASR